MALLLIQTEGTLWLIVAVLAIGWAATYVALRRTINRVATDLRAEMDERIRAVMISLKSAQAPAVQPLPKAEPAPVSQAYAPAPAVQPSEKSAEVSPEVLVMIAAAVTAFLGKKVRIRSAKMLQTPYEIVNPWVQQGRVVVQASHNLGPRGRS